METNEIKKQEVDQPMEIDGSMMSVLNDTRKWTKFLAIMGFIWIGFVMLMGIIVSVSMSALENTPGMENLPFAPGVLGFIYIIMALIYLPPVIF